MGRGRAPADEVEALREATREAHEAVQSLNQARKALAADAAAAVDEVIAARAELVDMVKAIWDAKFEELALEQFDKHFSEFATNLEKITDGTYARFDRISNLLLNGVDSAEFDDTTVSEIERMVVERIEAGTPGVSFDNPANKGKPKS